MPMTFAKFTQMLPRAPGGYEIVETRPDGTQYIYRGRDLSAFVAYQDNRLHEHRVINPMGATVYFRDAAGTLHEGAAWQSEIEEARQVKNRKVGSTVMWGLRGKPEHPVQDIVRRGLRWGSGGR